ncbi:MAG: hypothetical protein ACI8Q1_000454 [Parvicella sp.]|jgi:hypothetical protein
MKIEIFSSVEELKADRVPRRYTKKELIAQKMPLVPFIEFELII